MASIATLMRASRLGAAALLCGLAFAANAQPAQAADKDVLSVGLGVYDVIRDDDSAIAASLEYQSAHKLWIFDPVVGLMGTADQSVYGYVGIAYDLKFSDHWIVTPSFAPGLYARGEGKDLGSTVEFRSAVQVAYQFDEGSRLGLLFYHMSNAGLSDHNPGTEVLMATYGLSLGK
ncbi:MAG TPA: acyloxyacyl hydrolase [Alphaproteobacteria bacterium]|jgi:hypothetical protein